MIAMNETVDLTHIFDNIFCMYQIFGAEKRIKQQESRQNNNKNKISNSSLRWFCDKFLLSFFFSFSNIIYHMKRVEKMYAYKCSYSGFDMYILTSINSINSSFFSCFIFGYFSFSFSFVCLFSIFLFVLLTMSFSLSPQTETQVKIFASREMQL